MQHWTVSPDFTRLELNIAALSRLIGAIGSTQQTSIASAALDLVRTRIAAHHCSMLSFEGDRNPRLLSGASVRSAWHVFNAASAYSHSFFRQDDLLRVIARYPASFEAPPVIVHYQRLEDIECPDYRAQCYENVDIIDRLAILVRVAKSQSLAVNFYRDRSAGHYSETEIHDLLGMAPLFANCVARHYAFDTDGESSFRGAVTDELSDICPQLTVREREVVQRILDGATTERIAEDLKIRPTTVITYRTRAYEKLGVSSRRELFATVLRKRNVAVR